MEAKTTDDVGQKHGGEPQQEKTRRGLGEELPELMEGDLLEPIEDQEKKDGYS